ncbi:hypothetical protein BUALT_Bualt03G0054500 [Buddleja alternifolia]|uniref:Uncharacterized protein n=1 Tax=Buddleja alternifolia TaxID=168488 RepID=A0AAV6XY16_9LAMI|nr:hypothetical protein BUALT_Bualt03G0054500 [Buddleja alternifolia]
MTKKMCPDVTADIASSESLSFAGLICISQSDHSLPTTLAKECPKLQKQEPEFEFSSSKTNSTINSPKNNFQADNKLFSIPHLGTTISSNQHQVSKQNGLKDLKQSDLRSSNRKQNFEVKRRANEKPTARKSFGQRLFSSFATPCRDCRTIEATASVKQQQA